jgi:hypothetical protein
LYWRWPGQPQELVPASAFWHTEEDLRQAQALRDGKLKMKEVFPLETKAEIYLPEKKRAASEPIRLPSGPHLFLDDFLIASSTDLTRRVNRPRRDPAIPNPLITGKEDGCFQPYMTVLHDPGSGRLRLWYNHRTEDFNAGQSHLGYLESEEGIHWLRPPRVLQDPAPIQFGASVLDEGPNHPDPARRFKYGWWKDGGLQVASSPDGLTWTPLTPGVVLFHNHDINSIFYDPLRQKYVATISVYETGPAWSGQRRVTMQSYSPDLRTWETPHYVLTPDDRLDEGETQFYATDGFLVRGDLTIGMVKVLRDDLKADDPPDPPEQYGIGYTTLAWTRDGETWVRDREVFFDRHPEKGTWDHAHAWVDEQVLVGDEVYLYYGGYTRGHKVNRFEERQIGLVKMKRDRYVSREAGAAPGTLRTPQVILEATGLTLNAKVDGEIRVRILDATGQPLPGFDWDDCDPIRGDSLAYPVNWKGSWAALRGQAVRLEFALREAALYGFELIP